MLQPYEVTPFKFTQSVKLPSKIFRAGGFLAQTSRPVGILEVARAQVLDAPIIIRFYTPQSHEELVLATLPAETVDEFAHCLEDLIQALRNARALVGRPPTHRGGCQLANIKRTWRI
jgi:hypothetical protein